MTYISSWSSGETTVYVNRHVSKEELCKIIHEQNVEHFYSDVPIYSLLKKYGIVVDSSNTPISDVWFNIVLKK